MDLTANEAPYPYTADGYPTLYLATTNSKNDPIKYEGGGRELDDLIEFIETKSTVELVAPKKDEL